MSTLQGTPVSSFMNARFPDSIAMGAVGGAGYKTDVVEFVNGKEQRNVRWSSSRMAWDVAHAIKTQDEMNQLIAFFRNCRGRATGFLFKDWTDYDADQTYFASADGTTKVFPCKKTYSDTGSFDPTVPTDCESRVITRPIQSTMEVFVNGQASSDWTLGAFGVITFGSPPPAGAYLSWSGEFDVPVRFDTDQMKLTMDDYNILSWGSIPIIEIKEVP